MDAGRTGQRQKRTRSEPVEGLGWLTTLRRCLSTARSSLLLLLHGPPGTMSPTHPPRPPLALLLLSALLTLLLLAPQTHAIKFALQAYRYPPAKCIWNSAHPNALVIVTANVGPGPGQRVDVEIVDSSPQKNVYLHKKGINGETRLAVTAHAEGEVGVCFRNYLDHGACAVLGLGLGRGDEAAWARTSLIVRA